MIISKIIGNESYIYRNGILIHKTYIDNSQSGITFNEMAYRKNDILKKIE